MRWIAFALLLTAIGIGVARGANNTETVLGAFSKAPTKVSKPFKNWSTINALPPTFFLGSSAQGGGTSIALANYTTQRRLVVTPYTNQSANRIAYQNANLSITYDQFMALNDARLPSENNPLATLMDITTAGYTSNYLFCEDEIFGGTTPKWRELERQSDGGIIGSHSVTAVTYTEMDRYVTPALGTTIIPGGTWKFTMYAKLNIAQKEGMLKVSINRVDLNGTILSELGTAESDFFSNTLVVPIIISKYLGEQIGWDATDRIGIIVSGKRGAEDGATVTWYHDAASGWASIMETPVTLLHNQMQGLNDGDYKHLTANEKLGFNNLSGHYIQKVSPPSGQTITGGSLTTNVFNIPVTTGSTLGIIKQNGYPLLHTYGTYNLFLGDAAGNLSLTGSANTGIGHGSLGALTTGNFNTAIGLGSLGNGNSSENAAFGRFALYQANGGNNNSALGNGALQGITNGYANTGVGWGTGKSVTTGNHNTFIGFTAGWNDLQKVDAGNSMALGNDAYTTANNQVVIGNTSVTETILRGVVTTGGVKFPDGTTQTSAIIDEGEF
jgi:hypothetical protein